MALLILLVCAVTMQDVSPQQPHSVLLIPLHAKDDLATRDYKAVIPLTSPEHGVSFDIDGDGKVEQVAWTKRDAPAALGWKPSR